MTRIGQFFSVVKESATGFIEDNAFKLSASLSYYTVFSMGPLLIIIISLAGIFYGEEAVRGEIYEEIGGMVGSGAAKQIQDIIGNIQQSDQGVIGAVVGAILLVVGATGVFVEMQSSINYIWSVKAKPKKGWLRLLTNRLLSFSLIISMGFILLVSLILSAALDVLSDRLMAYFEGMTVFFFNALNMAMVIIVIAALFVVIFKVLPDAHIRWRDAFIGAIFTSVLFLLGKFAISFYLGRSNLGTTYGAASSIVVILSWVYYSASILYFGAEFTKVYAVKMGGGIRPDKTAVFIVKQESAEMPDTYTHPDE